MLTGPAHGAGGEIECDPAGAAATGCEWNDPAHA